MTDFMTEEQRLAQRRSITLALSGKTRKVPSRLRPKRKRPVSTLAWS
jgi:hypothetical protein